MMKNKEILDYLVEVYNEDYKESIETSMDEYGTAYLTIHELFHETIDFDIKITIVDASFIRFEFIFKNDFDPTKTLEIINTIVQTTCFGVYVNEEGLLVLKDEIHRITSLDELQTDLDYITSEFFSVYTQKNLKRLLKKRDLAA